MSQQILKPRSGIFDDPMTLVAARMFSVTQKSEVSQKISHESINQLKKESIKKRKYQNKRSKMVKKFTPSQVTIEKKQKKETGESNRPASDPWRQNKLNAWSPVYTPKAVLPSMMIIGTAFIPVGIGLIYTSYHVEQFKLDYTDCISSDHQSTTCASLLPIPGESNDFVSEEFDTREFDTREIVSKEFGTREIVSEEFGTREFDTSRKSDDVAKGGIRKKRCFCNIKFRLNHDFDRDVFLYYGLSGYYQSLRRYG